jgi:hypothetical protein
MNTTAPGRLSAELLNAVGFQRSSRHNEINFPTYSLTTAGNLQVQIQERNDSVWCAAVQDDGYRSVITLADVFELVRQWGQKEKAAELRRALFMRD